MKEFQVGDVVTVIATSSGYGNTHTNTLPQWLDIGGIFTITDKSIHHYVDGEGYKYQTINPDNGVTWWLCDGCIDYSDNRDLPLFRGVVNE